MTTKHDYELVFKSRFDQWGREVNDIMHKIEHADPQTKNYLNGKLEEIHALRQDAREHQQKLIDSNETAWIHLKDEIEEVWDKIENAFQKTRD